MNSSLLLFALLAQFLAGGTRRYPGDALLAWARAIEDHIIPAVFAGLGATLMAAILQGPVAGMDVALALVAALLFFPALTLELHHFLPRRRSVEDLYGS